MSIIHWNRNGLFNVSGSYMYFDNFGCGQWWWNIRSNGDISVSNYAHKVEICFQKVHRKRDSGQRMASRVTSPAVNIVLKTICLLHILSELKVQFVTASAKWNEINCDEAPPNCSTTSQYFFGANLDYYSVLDNVNTNEIYVAYTIDSLYTLCSLDPWAELHALNEFDLDNATLTIDIFCETHDTRIVIKSDEHNLISPTMVLFSTDNCDIFWKDLSKIGRYANLNGLLLHNWRDEFELGESIFFTTCVQLQNTGAKADTGKPLTVIAGMTNVTKIRVGYKNVRRISPVFTHHVWPIMAVFQCAR